MQEFEIDTTELEKWALTMKKKAPKAFQRASASMLTEFAFGTRNTSIEVIREKFVVRSTRFVEGHIRAYKANRNTPVEQQSARAGSISSKRFTGWLEQETGARTPRERTVTLLARSKRRSGVVKPGFRFKPSQDFPKATDFPGKNTEHKHSVMLSKLRRQGFKKPFLVTQKKGLPAGLYRLVRGKPKMLQTLVAKQPKKQPWHIEARKRFFRRLNMARVWKWKLNDELRRLR